MTATIDETACVNAAHQHADDALAALDDGDFGDAEFHARQLLQHVEALKEVSG